MTASTIEGLHLEVKSMTEFVLFGRADDRRLDAVHVVKPGEASAAVDLDVEFDLTVTVQLTDMLVELVPGQ